MSLYFYATREDLFSVLDGLEQRHGLVYRWCGQSSLREVPVFGSAREIRAFGMGLAATEGCPTYLVLPRSVRYEPNELPLKPAFPGMFERLPPGTPRSIFWVGAGEDTPGLELRVGGVYRGQAVVCSRAWPADSSARSGEIFSDLRSSLAAMFRQHGPYFIGPDADGLAKKGYRLTFNANEGSNFDLEL